MGRAGGKADSWPAEEVDGAANPMDLRNGHAEESAAVEICLRTVDPRDDRDRDPATVRCEAEPYGRGAAPGSARSYLPEAAVPCIPTESVPGGEVAAPRVSTDQCPRPQARRGSLFRRRGGYSLRLSRWN